MIVYVAESYSGHRYYHTNEDCMNLTAEYRTIEKEKVTPIYELCELCNGTRKGENSGSNDKQCPYCGEIVGKLPPHLVKCQQSG